MPTHRHHRSSLYLDATVKPSNKRFKDLKNHSSEEIEDEEAKATRKNHTASLSKDKEGELREVTTYFVVSCYSQHDNYGANTSGGAVSNH